ncbi:hypothetical protein M3Y97_00689300 [Aphelenchoides bicaudatus]|nr:hypothetical protein M3Y97_00689300 [Aphelenchoides bicaudatus]
MTTALNKIKPNLVELTACNLEYPDDFNEDFHPFYFDDFLYYMIWSSTGDRKLLSVNLKTGDQNLLEFTAQFPSIKSIIRKFRPLPTSFRTNKPGFVIVENFNDAEKPSCTIHNVEVDIERNVCIVLEEPIHEFHNTNFCEIDFVKNDHTLLLHYETKKSTGNYTIYELRANNNKSYYLKPLIGFPFDGKWIFNAHIFGDYLVADRAGYQIFVRNLQKQKSKSFDYAKPKFFSYYMGTIVTSNGLRMYFMDHIKQPHFSEVGIIDVSGDLNVSEYRNLFTLPTGWWKAYGVSKDVMYLGNSTDGGYIYYKLPIRDHKVDSGLPLQS